MIILGAGLSGLICGALNAQSQIYERNSADFVSHRAVLRFRDDKIARALGLTFRKVAVRKAVWYDGKEVAPSPRLANWYSRKVRGTITENSLWNVAPSERFIAPDNLHQILADICGKRVHWGTDIDSVLLHELCDQGSLISTIPIPILLKLLVVTSSLHFTNAPIYVDRYTVDECDVFQTIYFPDPNYNVYRATLTGNLLTVESAGMSNPPELEDVVDAFGLFDVGMLRNEATHKQSFGKIAPVPEGERKALLHHLTTEHHIYSLGRFATWRNILLDDVFEDIAVIRRMMAQSQYDYSLERTR